MGSESTSYPRIWTSERLRSWVNNENASFEYEKQRNKARCAKNQAPIRIPELNPKHPSIHKETPLILVMQHERRLKDAHGDPAP